MELIFHETGLKNTMEGVLKFHCGFTCAEEIHKPSYVQGVELIVSKIINLYQELGRNNTALTSLFLNSYTGQNGIKGFIEQVQRVTGESKSYDKEKTIMVRNGSAERKDNSVYLDEVIQDWKDMHPADNTFDFNSFMAGIKRVTDTVYKSIYQNPLTLIVRSSLERLAKEQISELASEINQRHSANT